MTALRTLTRTFTPLGWIVAALLVGGLALLLLGGLGFRFDPFDQARKRAETAEAAVEAITLDRDARAIEADGAADTAARADTALRQVQRAEAILHHFTIDAEAAHDADAPPDPDRLRRLRDADERLCGLRPALCPGHAAAPGDAGPGDGALHPPAHPG